MRFLAAERGITQFLDVGAGIPTAPNLHEVVQALVPQSRIVYADNDPIVLAHARALLTSTPEGATAYIHADLREPQSILQAAELRDTLDLSQPIGLTAIAVMQFVADDTEAYRIVRQVMDELAPGSYLALSTVTEDFDPVRLAHVRQEVQARGETQRYRTKAEVMRFFDGLEMVEPGVVQVHKWRPDASDVGSISEADVAMYGGLARRP